MPEVEGGVKRAVGACYAAAALAGDGDAEGRPERLAAAGATPRAASTIEGAARHGRPVRLDEMPAIDLLGLLRPETPIVTLVHPLQIVPPGTVPMTRHDISVDRVVTPDEAIETHARWSRPAGVYDEDLPAGKRAAIPWLSGS